MTNTPIGLGPATNTTGIGQATNTRTGDAIQFRMLDKGSTITELLRGKIGQLRMQGADSMTPEQQPNFRTLMSPSEQVLQVTKRLQNNV